MTFRRKPPNTRKKNTPVNGPKTTHIIIILLRTAYYSMLSSTSISWSFSRIFSTDASFLDRLFFRGLLGLFLSWANAADLLLGEGERWVVLWRDEEDFEDFFLEGDRDRLDGEGALVLRFGDSGGTDGLREGTLGTLGVSFFVFAGGKYAGTAAFLGAGALRDFAMAVRINASVCDTLLWGLFMVVAAVC